MNRYRSHKVSPRFGIVALGMVASTWGCSGTVNDSGSAASVAASPVGSEPAGVVTPAPLTPAPGVGAPAIAPAAGPLATPDPAAPGVDPTSQPPVAGEPADPVTTPPVAVPDPACAEADAAIPPLRRLTKLQYANSVRDLLSIDVDVAGLIGADEALGTFVSNISTAATRVDVEGYRGAAERAAEAAVGSSPHLACEAGEAEADCAERVLSALVPRALRRPATDVELGRYQSVYEAFSGDSHERALRVAVQALLQSPYFVYHVERGVRGGAEPSGGDLLRLTDHEVAARLSFFLWNTMPDEQLRTMADAGQLQDTDNVLSEARRLLNDPRSGATLDDFHGQWLKLQELDNLTKSADAFPDFDAQVLGPLLKAETLDFAKHVIREGDGTLSALLTSNEVVASDAILEFYGVERPAGAGPDATATLDPAERAGLLTRAGFLAAHAHHDQTSPVSRGVMIRENLLCQHLPSPPADVDATPPELDPNETTRERFAHLLSNPVCGGCHVLIDNIGLGFENYDAVGQFRSTENGQAVDGAGLILNGGDLEGPFDGAIELSVKAAGSPLVHDCMASQWLSYALGRSPTDNDSCSLNTIQSSFRTTGGSIPQLLESVVVSDAFRMMKVGF